MKNINIDFITKEVMRTTLLQPEDIKVVLMPETKKVQIFLTKDVEDDTLTDDLFDYVREFGFYSNIYVFSNPQFEVIDNG